MPFDLTTEPWLPCRWMNGKLTNVGLSELFIHAHEIEALDHPSPLVTLALHRLFLAVLHRVVGPSSIKNWIQLYQSGAFPESVPAYLKAHQECFDLLHPTRPFYQTRGLPVEYEADGIGRLILERSNYGSSVQVFQHRPSQYQDTEVLSFAEAAQHLVALHNFTPGGLVKKPGEPGSASAGLLNRGAYVMVRGANLFQTLVLNLCIYDPENASPMPGIRQKDIPAWEQAPMARPTGEREPKRPPYGYIDWLTWQSRRLELKVSPDGNGIIGLVYCVAKGIEGELPRDPMLAYRADKTRGFVAIDMSEDRALWRDCHALVREMGSDGACPAIVKQLANADIDAVLEDQARFIEVWGMQGDQAKILIARMEHFQIPKVLLNQTELQGFLRDGSVYVEEVYKQLRSAAFLAASTALSPGTREPHKDDVRRLLDAFGIERTYWGVLAEPFFRFLAALPEKQEDALSHFQGVVKKVAQSCLAEACAGLGSSSRHLKALALAEVSLNKNLALLQIQGETQ